MKLPHRTLVSWNIYFHDVEWLQTRTPPLYFMHDSNKIDFNHTVYILTETTLMPADIDIRYWQIPELKKKKRTAWQIRPKNINCNSKNSVYKQHSTYWWNETTHGYVFLKSWTKSSGSKTQWVLSYMYFKPQLSFWYARIKINSARI